MKNITTGLALVATLAFVSCIKTNDSLPLVNGYSLNGIYYEMDSMTMNGANTVQVWSDDHGGAVLTLQRLKPWPTADGNYEYPPWIMDKDSIGVRISFRHDSSATEYYSVPPANGVPSLVYTVAKGKRELFLSSNYLNDSRELNLRITAKE